MIFIGVFLLIAIIFGVLNFIDSNNIEKIEKYLKNNSCSEIVYVNGNYQAFCKDKIIIVENKFSLELEKSKVVHVHDIKDLKNSDMAIIINSDFELKFKDKVNQEKFYNILKGPVK